MHSKIFQIGLNPMNVDNYIHPDEFYENFNDFADYIGDEVDWEDRQSFIDGLVGTFDGILEYNKGTLVYKGMNTFLEEWAAAIQQAALELNEDNILKNLNLYKLSRLTEKTHKDTCFRFYIEGWNGYAAPASDLIEFLAQQKVGTKLYIGSIIDYHF